MSLQRAPRAALLGSEHTGCSARQCTGIKPPIVSPNPATSHQSHSPDQPTIPPGINGAPAGQMTLFPSSYKIKSVRGRGEAAQRVLFEQEVEATL